MTVDLSRTSANTPLRKVHALKPEAKPNFIEDAKPWPNVVRGAELLDGITEVLKSLIIAPLPCIHVASVWAVYTHVFDAVHTSPILAFVSPQKRCGKTSALTALSYLVRRPLGVSNITPAALYRAVDKWHPTLLIDEAETFMTSQEEIRGIINSGHKRSMARVVRSVGDRHEPHAFSTWCPKAIARIGALDATLADRAIVIPLRRKRISESVQSLGAPAIAQLQILGQQAARWGIDEQENLPSTNVELKGLNDRARDNWAVLMQIAAAAGGRWPQITAEASRYFAHLDDESDTEEASTMILADIRRLFISIGEFRLSSQMLAQLLAQMEHRPWPEWKRDRPITPRQIAELLAPYKIRPKSIRLSDLGTPKGYDRDQFEDAFDRYLSPPALTSPKSESQT